MRKKAIVLAPQLIFVWLKPGIDVWSVDSRRFEFAFTCRSKGLSYTHKPRRASPVWQMRPVRRRWRFQQTLDSETHVYASTFVPICPLSSPPTILELKTPGAFDFSTFLESFISACQITPFQDGIVHPPIADPSQELPFSINSTKLSRCFPLLAGRLFGEITVSVARQIREDFTGSIEKQQDWINQY